MQVHGQNLSSNVDRAVAAWEIKQRRVGFIEEGREAADLLMSVGR